MAWGVQEALAWSPEQQGNGGLTSGCAPTAGMCSYDSGAVSSEDPASEVTDTLELLLLAELPGVSPLLLAPFRSRGSQAA